MVRVDTIFQHADKSGTNCSPQGNKKATMVASTKDTAATAAAAAAAMPDDHTPIYILMMFSQYIAHFLEVQAVFPKNNTTTRYHT